MRLETGPPSTRRFVARQANTLSIRLMGRIDITNSGYNAHVFHYVMNSKNASCAALFVSAGLFVSVGCAQSYPVKPVRVIVPFAPGGGGDLTARAVSEKYSEKFKHQFVVDNRGGGGGLMGLELAAKSLPDGYTILIMSSSFSSTSATHRPAFDPINSIAAVGEIGKSPFVISVHPSLPAKSTMELIELARERPGQLVYAIPGIGSITHLATELMLNTANIKMIGAPYKGTGPAMIDLLAGRTQLIVGSLPPLLPHFRSGRLRPLSVTSTKRWHSVPDLPTLGETLPGYAVENWYGVMVPGGTPKFVIDRLNVTLNQFLGDKDMQASLEREGVQATGSTPAQFGATMLADYKRWLAVVDSANIKP
jgi:tripartite-type tricarboxylate transporter receptor subunit TctC